MMGFTPQKTERNLNREYLLVCTHDDESSIKDRILKNFARQLEHSNEGPFFFGSQPYYCDFSVYHHFSLAIILQQDILDAYPSVLDFMVAVKNLSGVKEYLASRPEIIDTGTAPKLIIDGIAMSTGTNPS